MAVMIPAVGLRQTSYLRFRGAMDFLNFLGLGRNGLRRNGHRVVIFRSHPLGHLMITCRVNLSFFQHQTLAAQGGGRDGLKHVQNVGRSVLAIVAVNVFETENHVGSRGFASSFTRHLRIVFYQGSLIWPSKY